MVETPKHSASGFLVPSPIPTEKVEIESEALCINPISSSLRRKEYCCVFLNAANELEKFCWFDIWNLDKMSKESEILGVTRDKALETLLVYAGTGLGAGLLLSLLYKRKAWPIAAGISFGSGMAYQKSLEEFDIFTKTA